MSSLRSQVVNETLVLRNVLHLDAESVGDLLLKYRPEDLGVYLEIENAALRNLVAYQVE